VEAKPKEPAITCIGSLTSHLVTVDATKAIHIYPVEQFNDVGDQCDGGVAMPAHRDAVLGIGLLKTPNKLAADFFTWSCKGVVKFWNTRGECCESRTIAVEQLPGGDDDTSNGLKVLRTNSDMDFFVSGDKLGVLRYCFPGSRYYKLTNLALEYCKNDHGDVSMKSEPMVVKLRISLCVRRPTPALLPPLVATEWYSFSSGARIASI
jgi:hypothetical protein